LLWLPLVGYIPPERVGSGMSIWVRAGMIAVGLVVLDRGLVRMRHLRRWQPASTDDLSGFDPGPDLLDWIGAIGLIAVGLAAMIAAVLL
jgi:hypothetical protein